MTVECFNEDKPSELNVEELKVLIDKALTKGLSTSWVLDEVAEAGAFPSSIFQDDGFQVVNVTHFTKEMYAAIEAKIDAVPDAEKSPPSRFEVLNLIAAFEMNGFKQSAITDLFLEKGIGIPHSGISDVQLTWAQYDELMDQAMKEFYEEQVEGEDLEDQVDKLLDHADNVEAAAKAKLTAEKKAIEKLKEAGVENISVLEEATIRAEKEIALKELYPKKPEPGTAGSEWTSGILATANLCSTNQGIGSCSIAMKDADTAESAATESESEEVESSSSPKTKPTTQAQEKSSKSKGKKAGAGAKSKDGSPRASEGEVEYGYTTDPDDYVINAFRRRDIDLAIIEFNQQLADQGISAWIQIQRGPEPTFKINVDGDDQDVRNQVDLLIPEKLRADLRRACKHVVTAISSICRKLSEIEDLKANAAAIERGLKADLEAINQCYAAEIQEWADRKIESQKKPDGSYRTKTIKTLGGVLSYTKSGGLRVTNKDELIASILEKPEEEQQIFPIQKIESVDLDLEALRESGLLASWEELELRGVVEEEVKEIGNFSIKPKARGSEN